MSFSVPHSCWKQQISTSTSNKLLLSVKTAGIVLHRRKKPTCVCSPPASQFNNSNSRHISERGDTSFLLQQKMFAQPPLCTW